MKTLVHLRMVLLALAVVGSVAQAEDGTTVATPSAPATAKRADSALCPPLTGSRLPHTSMGGNCDLQPGVRVYGREDILRTGEPSLGEALRDLDPSLNVGRGVAVPGGIR